MCMKKIMGGGGVYTVSAFNHWCLCNLLFNLSHGDKATKREKEKKVQLSNTSTSMEHSVQYVMPSVSIKK